MHNKEGEGMIKKIKSVSELPDWFKKRQYKKKLSKIDWYREIRQRQIVSGMIENSTTSISDAGRTTLIEILTTTPFRNSPIFLIPQGDRISQGYRPIHDLTAGEALFFHSAISDDDLIQLANEFDRLLVCWRNAIKEEDESDDGPTPLMGQYKALLEKFFAEIDNKPYINKINEPICNFTNNAGNPWLFYSRVLNGWPITVDTEYDDETIIKYFKGWLAKKRKTEGERLRRPFIQNDLDDWSYFKIREVFDLETWAILANVKILDKVLAQALWPISPDDFSPIDVLRTTSRKKAKEIFTFPVVVRLHGQLLLENGENFLEQ